MLTVFSLELAECDWKDEDHWPDGVHMLGVGLFETEAAAEAAAVSAATIELPFSRVVATPVFSSFGEYVAYKRRSKVADNPPRDAEALMSAATRPGMRWK